MEKRNVIEIGRTPKDSKQAEAMDEALDLFVVKKKEVKNGQKSITKEFHGGLGKTVQSC